VGFTFSQVSKTHKSRTNKNIRLFNFGEYELKHYLKYSNFVVAFCYQGFIFSFQGCVSIEHAVEWFRRKWRIWIVAGLQSAHPRCKSYPTVVHWCFVTACVVIWFFFDHLLANSDFYLPAPFSGDKLRDIFQ